MNFDRAKTEKITAEERCFRIKSRRIWWIDRLRYSKLVVEHASPWNSRAV